MASTIETIIRDTVTAGLRKISDFNRKRLPIPTDSHPYLTGIHTPLTQEYTLADLRVEGRIPTALSGRYLRNGPNPIGTPDPASYHWFTGPGMIHGIAIENGQALWYRNRWVRGAEAAEFLNEPLPPGPRRDGSDAPNTNVVGMAGRTFALVEAGGCPAELSNDLSTIAHNDFDGTLAGGYTAHPHFDPYTREYHAITYRGEEMNKVWHVVMNDQAHVIRKQAIAVSHGPSIHDCAITENYVLVFDLPVTFSMKALIKGYAFPYHWNADHPARIGLLPRAGSGGDILWVPVDPCYVFHPANAFETPEGHVVVDVVAHDTMFAQSMRGPDSKASALERWTIDPVHKETKREILNPHSQEFPRYNERLTTRPYRYIYSVAVENGPTTELDLAGTALFKHDLLRAQTQVRDFGPNHHPGEFVFTPRNASSTEPSTPEPSSAEDDGWLIGLVICTAPDAGQGHTELHILNADDFLGPPQAVIHLPHQIPPGFHGNWVPNAA